MTGEGQQSVPRLSVHSVLNMIGKYFIHGFVFSVVMYGANFILLFMETTLAIPDSIGFILGLGVTFLFLGWINRMWCKSLWDFEVKPHLTSLIGHGYVLFLVLLIIEVPAAVPLSFMMMVVSPEVVLLVYFASFSFVDGVIGKAIGWMFKEHYAPTTGPITVPEQRTSEQLQ